MNDAQKLQALQSDVDACRVRIAEQERKDADHEVALAMFRADLRRANFRGMEFLASRPVLEARQRRAA